MDFNLIYKDDSDNDDLLKGVKPNVVKGRELVSKRLDRWCVSKMSDRFNFDSCMRDICGFMQEDALSFRQMVGFLKWEDEDLSGFNEFVLEVSNSNTILLRSIWLMNNEWFEWDFDDVRKALFVFADWWLWPKDDRMWFVKRSVIEEMINVYFEMGDQYYQYLEYRLKKNDGIVVTCF